MKLTLLLPILAVFLNIQGVFLQWNNDFSMYRDTQGRLFKIPKWPIMPVMEVDFSDKFYDILRQEQEVKKENFVISPLSAETLLASLASGAEGTTLQELQNALGKSINCATQHEYKNLIAELNGVANLTINVLNKLYIRQDFKVDETFQQLARDNFRSTTQNIDFSNSREAANTINSWVAENTNNKIKNLIEPDSVSAETKMITTNVIYFKGHWEDHFSVFLTMKKNFYTNGRIDKKESVDTMTSRRVLYYGNVADLKASFVEIPYRGNEVVMLIVIPDEIDGLSEVERKLKAMNLQDLRKKGHLTIIDLYLPKFKVQTTVELKTLLQKMNVNSMFTNAANFQKMSSSPIYVSNAKQKVVIEVNEVGTEEAIHTYFEADYYKSANPQNVNVNRPFHYKIIKNKGDNDGTVLFAGNIYNIE